VPQTQRPVQKLPTFKQLTVHREDSNASENSTPERGTVPKATGNNEAETDADEDSASEDETQTRANSLPGLIENFVGRDSRESTSKAASAP